MKQIHHSALAARLFVPLQRGCQPQVDGGGTEKTVCVHGCYIAFPAVFGCFFKIFDCILLRRGGSSSTRFEKWGWQGLPWADSADFAERYFSVTSVTSASSNSLKPFIHQSYTVVTPLFKVPLALHCCYILLHQCYTYCYTCCYIGYLLLFQLLITIKTKNVTVNGSNRPRKF